MYKIDRRDFEKTRMENKYFVKSFREFFSTLSFDNFSSYLFIVNRYQYEQKIKSPKALRIKVST